MGKSILLRLVISFMLITVFILSANAQRRGKAEDKVKSVEEIQQEVEYLFIEAEKRFILKNYSQATEILNKCLVLDPTNDVVYYKLAEININTEQYGTAEPYILKALELNSSNKYYYLLAIEIYSNLGDLQKAADQYEKLITEVPKTSNYLFNLAATYLFLKDYDRALSTYNRAEQEFGLTEEIAFQRQKLYLQQNKLEEAINEGKNLMNAFPANPRYVSLTAEILSTNNRLDEATSLLIDLLKKQPDFSAARLQLADIYWKENNFDQFEMELKLAFKDAELILNAKINTIMKYMVYLPNQRLQMIVTELAAIVTQVHMDDSNSYLIAGDVYSSFIDKKLLPENDISDMQKLAATQYSQYVAMEPSNYNVWQNLLNLELQLDLKDSIAVHAEQALELFPNQAWLYLINGVAMQNANNHKAAAQLLEMGVKRAEGNRGLLLVMYGFLGDLYYELKQYPKSDAAYDKVLELDPLNFTVLNNYSYYLSLRGEKLDQAKAMCSKLIKSNPDNITYLDTYAWVHYIRGEYDEARRVFEKIMNIGVTEGVYYDHYGDVLYKLGLKEEAIHQWKEAKKLDNSIENIDKKINEGKIIQ